MNAPIQSLCRSVDLQAEAAHQLVVLGEHARNLRRQLALEDRWTIAKSITGASLVLHLALGLALETAIRASSRAAGEALHLRPGALKTRTSEARALLECVPAEAMRRQMQGAWDEALHAEIVFAVLPLSQRTALERRALRLRGRKGGRPPSARPALSEARAS